MLGALKVSRKELEDYQLGLEKTIEERTEELNASYQNLQLTHTYLEEAQAVATLGSWVFHKDTDRLALSPDFAKFLGFFEDKEITKNEFMLLVDDSDKEKVLGLFQNTSSDRSKDVEYLIYPNVGTPVYLLSRSRMIAGDDGDYLIGTALVITELKIKEKQILFASERANKAGELKNKLLTLLAHDLKGPIGGTLNLISLVQDSAEEDLSTENSKILETIDHALHQTLDLVDRIVELRKIKDATLQVNSSWVNLYELVEDLRLQLTGLLVKKEISLKNFLPLRESAYIDADLMKQVFQNLLTNAIKFCNHGGQIKVGKAEGKSCYYVEDNGIGVDPELLEDLFKLDYKTTSLGTGGEKGSGVGLPISSEIVQAHGGKLNLDPNHKKGSRFGIQL